MTADDIAELCEKMNAQRDTIRAALAEALGGDSADRSVTDDGE